METFITIMFWPVLVFAVSGCVSGLYAHSKVTDLEKRVKALESPDEKQQ